MDPQEVAIGPRLHLTASLKDATGLISFKSLNIKTSFEICISPTLQINMGI